MIEAIVFDFDGVLADTPKYYFEYMKKYLHNIHTDITDEDISHLVGMRFKQKFDYLDEKYSLGVSLEKFVEDVSSVAREEMKKSITPNKNLENFLNEIKAAEISMAIASSNSLANISFVLEKFKWNEYFEPIITVTDVQKHKPFPDAYIKALKIMKKKPKNCIGIEDTTFGVDAIKSAGMKAIAIPSKYTEMHDFSHADIVIRDFSEISLARIKGLIE